MSQLVVAPLNMSEQSPLRSHDPLHFASKIDTKSVMARTNAPKLFMVANWKLNTESSCDNPRLRRLLGHISVYDKTQAVIKQDATPSTLSPKTPDESTDLQQDVPSFKEFQAAIQAQLVTLAELQAASIKCREVNEYDSDEDDDDSDSDYYSYDEDAWSDDDAATVSDESITDNESDEGQRSECTSPTFHGAEDKDPNDEDLWAIRPVTSYMTSRSVS